MFYVKKIFINIHKFGALGPEAYFCSADMTNARLIFSFSLTALLLFSEFLPSSADSERALNPLSRVSDQQQRLQQQERQLAVSSFYSRKLGVHIKRSCRFPLPGPKSPAIRNRISSFNIGFVFCVSLIFLGFFTL